MTTPLNVFDEVLPKSFVAPVRSSVGDLIFSGRPDKYVPVPSGVSTVSVSTPAESPLIVNFANDKNSAQVRVGTFQKSGVFKVAARSRGGCSLGLPDFRGNAPRAKCRLGNRHDFARYLAKAVV